jgi:NAD(P)-dependent dehydrogenase (short-subunit alcohol dehydrogenase family)
VAAELRVPARSETERVLADGARYCAAVLGDPAASFRLEGQVAIVTGASSGLGRRFAEVLAAAGAKVALAARRREEIERLAAALPGAIAIETDVTSEEDRAALVDQATERLGPVDLLVNNAGAVAVMPALEERVEDFRSILEVNLVAPFALTQLVAAGMVERGGGVIVNVASVLGLVGSGRIPEASYAASKGALVNLTRELAAQWARQGVRVNALAPGWFASEMTAEMFASGSGQRFIERNTPMGRAGTAGELDGALLFLASSASSFVTGQVLCVDGGWTII